MKQVLDLLAEELNAKSGVMGKKVEVISEDDGVTAHGFACKPRVSTQGIVGVMALMVPRNRSYPEHLQ